MSLQALPRRRVASPQSIPAAKINLVPGGPSGSVAEPVVGGDLKRKLARILAELLRRMLPRDVATGKGDGPC